MPVSDFHRQVASIALTAAAEHGFVLGGGNALIMHGIVDRYTADVDLVTNHPGGQQALLQITYFERNLTPVAMDVGPVLNPVDAISSKVRAFVTRAEERDLIDVAAALETYTVSQLITMARELEPELQDEDFADAGRRIDRLGDKVFARYGLSPDDVSRLKQRFADWPRS